MPDDPFAFLASEPERPAERSKSIKKPHWREKLFSREKNNKHTTDQQLEAFLATARPKPPPHGIPTSLSSSLPPSNRDVSSSNRDVSSRRWPSSNDVSTSPASDPFSSDIRPPGWPLKTRARKGLKVAFTDQVPELIGEGGDDSEIPPMEVSLRRSRTHSRTPSKDPRKVSPRPPPLRVETSFGDGDGVGQRADWKPPLMHNPQNAELLMSLNQGDQSPRLSFRGSPESSTLAQRVRAKMQAEEGRALQKGFEDPPSPPSPSLGSPPTPPPHRSEPRLPDVSPRSPDSLYETPSVSETDSVPPPSYRPVPSPAAQAPADPSPVEPTLPSVAALGAASRLSPPKAPPIVPIVNEVASDRQSRPPSGGSRDTSRSPQPPKYSLRSVANQFGDTAFTEFKEFTARYTSLIVLAAESVKPLMETSLGEWMRAALWWFLRGKKRLETYARRSAPGASVRRGPSLSARQAVIDLGKALWINESIVPKHSEVTRYGSMSLDALLAVVSTTGDTHMGDLLSIHQAIITSIRSLAMSIKRNNILNTVEQEEASAEQLDTSIWIRYPFFAADVSAVLSGAATRSMLDKGGNGPTIMHTMPLSDSGRYFTYGSMFVQVCVSSREDDVQQFAMPCVLSIIRERADWYVFAAINSQSDLVNVIIQSDRKQGPTWDDVDWQVRSNSMHVKLPRGFELDVMFQEDDFRMIWNIVKYTLKAEASLEPEEGESVAFESTLKVFHYMDPGTPKAFPPEPLERCRIRLFERSVTVTEGTGTRNAHRGFRFTVLTSPKVKTLSNVRHIMGHGTPIVFGLLRGEDGAPALMLKVKEDGRVRSMLLTFYESSERTKMHSSLLGMVPKQREFKTSDIPMRSYAIEQPADKASGRPGVMHLQFPAGNVSVIDQEHDYVDHGYGPTILSEHLRVFTASEWGSTTDRINLGPGELRLGLDVLKPTGISLFRPAQQDLTVSVAENLTSAEMQEKLTEFLQKVMVQPMARRFDFASQKDLHLFEEAVTGFKVLFDSVATSFTISRRRMVVPIHKKWEANLARIQVVQQDRVFQMLVFFHDFNHGKCMNFVVKGTDKLEMTGRGGKFGVRIVDAKFALPKTDGDLASDFVCLDMPEYPMEHDDITIAFDSESDRTNFQQAMPGSVREPSRMGSLRR